MPDSDAPAGSPAPRKPAKPTQQEREARALRANLRRRKQQASLRDGLQENGPRQSGPGAEHDGPADRPGDGSADGSGD